VNPSGTAQLVGPDGLLHAGIVHALLAAGWEIATAPPMRARLDLGVFIPTNGTAAPLLAMSPARWWSCVGEDLTSAFHCAKELIPRLSRSGGALVFVSSLLGEIGAPDQTAFCAGAAGIIGLVKGLTVDVPAVRFSAVAPALPIPDEPWSSADVDWHAISASLDATSTARATANAVLFLANDKEGHHRGQVIRIPSGITT
jgi:3-oxoacyl-[acyl-carrier protein] reductase